jgi:hypothetical protein
MTESTYTQICAETGEVLARNVCIKDRNYFFVPEDGTENFYALNKYTSDPVYRFVKNAVV